MCGLLSESTMLDTYYEVSSWNISRLLVDIGDGHTTPVSFHDNISKDFRATFFP